VTERATGLRIDVYVKPRSSRSKVLGVVDGALSVALKAPPVGGEANAALLKLLAKRLGLKRHDLTIVAGMTGRRKVLQIDGLERKILIERLTER